MSRFVSFLAEIDRKISFPEKDELADQETGKDIEVVGTEEDDWYVFWVVLFSACLLLLSIGATMWFIDSKRLKELEKKMATLQDDVTRLTTDVTNLHGIVTQVSLLVTNLHGTITTLQAQVTALQGQANPDLSGLEAGLTSLEATTSQLAGVLPPSPTA